MQLTWTRLTYSKTDRQAGVLCKLLMYWDLSCAVIYRVDKKRSDSSLNENNQQILVKKKKSETGGFKKDPHELSMSQLGGLGLAFVTFEQETAKKILHATMIQSFSCQKSQKGLRWWTNESFYPGICGSGCRWWCNDVGGSGGWGFVVLFLSWWTWHQCQKVISDVWMLQVIQTIGNQMPCLSCDSLRKETWASTGEWVSSVWFFLLVSSFPWSDYLSGELTPQRQRATTCSAEMWLHRLI